MNINLPEQFIIRMQNILGQDFEKYLATFNMPSAKAIHLNTGLLSNDSFTEKYNNLFKKLPYAENGYTYNLEDIPKIGQHPLHHAGVIYSQDPGALMTVCLLPEITTDRPVVLDMCAAPGGKSSQLAIKLKALNGFLVSNEIDMSRNKILQSNMERMGYSNYIITNYNPSQIAINFPHAFDIIVVDAPCSGEGMFRKYPEAVNEWSIENVKMCSLRQKEIIDNAVIALKPGGYLLYSTCTYSNEENEDIINYIIDKYNFEVVNTDSSFENYAVHLSNDALNPGLHFYPHISYGEGQYMCLLKEKSEKRLSSVYNKCNTFKPLKTEELNIIYSELKNEIFIKELSLYSVGEYIYSIPSVPFVMPSKGVTKPGICIGTIDKKHSKRFIPDHHLFKAYGNLFSNKCDISNNDALACKYIHGEEIFIENVPSGYGVLTYNGGVLGGYKSVNGRLKNHYPKGLRNNN